MPNWVFNGLTIEGNPERVKALVEEMNKPLVVIRDSWNLETQEQEKKQITYTNPVFAFWNIICPSAEIMDEYDGQPPRTKAGLDDMPAWHKEIEEYRNTSNDWYNWNIRNWGTKWDVAVHDEEEHPDTYMEGPTENGENLVVYYNFNTAWSPPMEAIATLSSKYPSLLFTLSYEEEQGWGGECEFLRGEQISYSDYETKCRDCDAENTLEYCDTCGEQLCSKCNWMGEADLDAVKECDTHKVFLTKEHLPEYRFKALEAVVK